MASGNKWRIGGKVVYKRKGQRNAPPPPPVRDPANFKNASEAENLGELFTYMNAKHGVWINEGSLSRQDFKSVRNAAGEMEFIMNEFPQAKGAFSELRGSDLKSGVMATASLGGIITTSDDYFRSDYDLQSRYAFSVGFHPAGTTGNNVVTHESGHILEAALVRRANNNMATPIDRIAAISDWNSHTFAKKVVSEAAKNAKKTPDGKGMKVSRLIAHVSGYAESNRSETLAECVADYRANGAKAQPLSREVWKILKRELG